MGKEKNKKTPEEISQGIEKRKKNLKMFSSEYQPPAESRGHKKGHRHISSIMREMLEAKCSPVIKDEDLKINISILMRKPVSELTMEDFITYNALQKALKGDFRYHKDMLDRVYGQATQHIEIKDADEIDLSKLSEDEIKELAEIALKDKESN